VVGSDGAREAQDDDVRGLRLRALAVLAGLLVVLLLAGGIVWFLVGGDHDDPKRRAPGTTQAGFCKALQGFQARFASIDPSSDLAAYISELKGAARALRAAGVPETMPADAQAGLAHYLGEILALGDDATAADVSRIGTHESPEDQQALDAMNGYIASACPA
jgi:hypothetical protein